MQWSEIKEMTEAIKNLFLLLFYIAMTIFFFVFLWPLINDKVKNKDLVFEHVAPVFYHPVKMLRGDIGNLNDRRVHGQIVRALKGACTGDLNWAYFSIL